MYIQAFRKFLNFAELKGRKQIIDRLPIKQSRKTDGEKRGVTACEENDESGPAASKHGNWEDELQPAGGQSEERYEPCEMSRGKIEYILHRSKPLCLICILTCAISKACTKIVWLLVFHNKSGSLIDCVLPVWLPGKKIVKTTVLNKTLFPDCLHQHLWMHQRNSQCMVCFLC